MSIQHEFNPQNIKLIVGLGNVGRDYAKTRHNAGFLFLDSLTNEEFREEPKFKALISKFEAGSSKLLAKPVTMMNLSGDSVQLILNFYKIKPEEILVAHDDLDIQFGKYKIQFDKGPRIHNGVNDIESRLRTTKFWRLRIGIENRDQRENSETITHNSQHITGRDYVLGKFTYEELQVLNATFKEVLNNLQ